MVLLQLALVDTGSTLAVGELELVLFLPASECTWHNKQIMNIVPIVTKDGLQKGDLAEMIQFDLHELGNLWSSTSSKDHCELHPIQTDLAKNRSSQLSITCQPYANMQSGGSNCGIRGVARAINWKNTTAYHFRV
ncbi:UNVERIFIED_CONTAM: hypothetical protein Sindi_2305200 [Sesamum indicum]